MNDKQTAVEWFSEIIRTNRKFSWDAIVEQAKQLEKEQIIRAYMADLYPCSFEDAEEYYNNTYETQQ